METRRRHSSNSSIPVFDTKPVKEIHSSDQNLFQPSVTRLPSFKHKPNRQKLSLTTRKCLSSNVTPISSPIIPRSINNNYQPTVREFSKEVIESSAKLIDDIDTTLSQLSRQYYSDNNNLFESNPDTSPTSLQNNNGVSHFSDFNKQSCDCTSMSKLKLTTATCHQDGEKVRAALKQSNIPSPYTEVPQRPTKLPVTNHSKNLDLNYLSNRKINGRKQNPSYTEAWIYNTQERPGNEPRNLSQVPVHQSYNNTHLLQKSIFSQHRHNRTETNHSPKYTPKIPLPNRHLKNLSDESVTNRDSGIYLSCSKEEHSQDTRVTVASQPQPPPRVSSLVNPSTNGNETPTQTSKEIGLLDSITKVDETKKDVVVEGYCSDVDNLKNSGYFSDYSGYMSEGGVQKMQYRFRESLVSHVEEPIKSNKIVANKVGSLERDDISSTSSDEIEVYLRELSNRLECPYQFEDVKTKISATGKEGKMERKTGICKEKYICDVDFDVTSSSSMDLLVGMKDDSVDYKHLRSIDLKRPSDVTELSPRKSSLDCGTQANRARGGIVEILESAGPTAAIFEDVNPVPVHDGGASGHYRAMSLPGRPRPGGGWHPLPPPPPPQTNNHVYYEVPVCRGRSARTGGTSTPSLLNVRLPYAISSQGVKNSSSTTSLGKRDSDNEDAYDGLGSHLSLLSTGSYRSLNEERQATEIRKLRRDLEIAQSKVRTLSGQLSNNGTLVAAFEGTLQSMSMRLQRFAASSESKESELNDLKTTIESLKKQAGSTLVQPLDPSSPKIYTSSSLTSLNSNSNSHDKRSDSSSKKSSWFKASLGRAFKKKSSKDDGSTESMNEISRSPKNIQSMLIESESLQAMRKELEEKDARLTDVQLDALSRSHQLEQLRDQLTKMRYEMSSLKADNNRLQCLMTTSNVAVSSTSMDRSVGGDSATDNEDLNGTLKNSSKFKDLNVQPKFDFLNGLVRERSGAEAVTVYIVVKDTQKTIPLYSLQVVDETTAIPIGRVGVTSMMSWSDLENGIRCLLKEYVSAIDPVSSLGLSGDSIARYSINGTVPIALSSTAGMRPLTSPLAACDKVPDSRIYLELKNLAVNNSIDDEAFEFLIPKSILMRYFGLLMDHRRIILSGPSGTGKTYLANKLARNIASRFNRDAASSILVFNLDKKSTKELRNYMATLTEQLLKTDPNSVHLPLVIVLDNLHHVSSYNEIFNSFMSIHHSRSPFVIGTMNQLNTTASNNLQLHHNFRWVLCTNHTEPVKGFLGRYLRRQFLKHQLETRESHEQLYHIIEWISIVWQHINKFLETYSSPDVTIGPRLFLHCPMSIDSSKMWFIDLWNYSLVPYVLDAVRDGLNTHGRNQATWDDPTDWIIRSWPWNDPYNSLPVNGGHDTSNLIRLRPEDVGFDSYQLITTTSAHIGPYSLSAHNFGLDPVTANCGRHSLMLERKSRISDKTDCHDNMTALSLNIQDRSRRKK